jgi:hypothetical protein
LRAGLADAEARLTQRIRNAIQESKGEYYGWRILGLGMAVAGGILVAIAPAL